MAWSRIFPGRRLMVVTGVLILIGLVVFVMLAVTTPTGQGIVAGLVSRALSTETRKVSIGRIEGLLSSDLTIREIEVADREGAWLNVDAARILWKPLELFRLRLGVEVFEVDRLEIRRKPVSDDTQPASQEPFRLPQLPIAVAIERFSLASVVLDQDLFGTAAVLAAEGNAGLDPSKGVALVLDVERRDRPGRGSVRLTFDPASEALRASLHLDEPAGGIFAEIIELPDRPPVTLAFDGEGTLDDFRSTLAFRAGPEVDADGTLALSREGAARNLVFDLAARLPTIAFSRMNGTFAAVAKGEAPGSFDLSGEAEVTGLKLADPALSDAIGSEVRLTMRGFGQTTGSIDFQSAKLVSPNLSIDFKGLVSTDATRGRLVAEMPDLSRFAALAGLALRGEATLAADLAGVPNQNLYSATIDATARRFATGDARIDGLFGGTPRLEGSLRYDPEKGFAAENARLTGAHASARVEGVVSSQAADLTARLSIPSLEKADERLAGRGEATVRVTGTLERPDATLEARISEGALLGRAVPSLVLEARATDLRGAVEAQARLDGTIGGKLARGTISAARTESGAFRFDPLDLAIGSVTVTGAGTVDPAAFVSGKLEVHARDLDDLSPLVLDKLAGSLDADVIFSRQGEGQDVAVRAEARKLTGFGMGLVALDADVTATDVRRRPALSGSAEARDLRIGGETVTRLRLEAKGAPDASDVTVTASARGIDLAAGGRIVPAEPMRLELTKFDAVRGRTRVGLAGPATLTMEDGGATIRGLGLAANGGRLSVDGRAGPKSDLKIGARAVPLAVADLVAPDFVSSGTLEGEAMITGPLGAPRGTYRFRLEKAVSPRTKEAGLPPIDAEASGRLEGARATLDAIVTASEAGRMTIKGSVPLTPAGSLDLSVKGNLDISAAGRTLAVEGRRIAGAVVIDGRVTGTLERPNAAGSAVVANGSFQDAVQGTRLDGIRARLVARDDKITIENASATARNGGQLTISGEVRIDPAGGFPGSIKVAGQRVEIVRSALATAVVDIDLAMTGPLARAPRIGGKVGIETLDVSIAAELGGAARPLDDTRHIRPTPTAQRRLALAAAQRRGAAAGAPFDAALDVTVNVPGRIRVTGRGLDAELGGSVKIAGTLARPEPDGAFHLVRGRMRILTSELDITRANLAFAGDLSPQLDFVGTTQAGGASIRVAVTGNPRDPHFSFTSSPDYPQDEVLSRLLFGQGSGRLTPTQALALTQAVAIYSGGTSALENLRRSLGLGEESRSSNPLTNWLGDRVSLGIRTGATPAQTGVGVDISIWKQLKARGAIDARGAASVGVGAETEW